MSDSSPLLCDTGWPHDDDDEFLFVFPDQGVLSASHNRFAGPALVASSGRSHPSARWPRCTVGTERAGSGEETVSSQ